MDTESTEDLLSEFGSLPGNLQLTKIIGRGSSGIVARALELTLDREVAIKILFNTGSEASEERFEREMKVLASMDHKNIVKILTRGTSTKGNRFYTMEWLEGQSLADQLQQTPVLPDQ